MWFINFLLTVGIVAVSILLLYWVRKFFFVKRQVIYASSLKRAWAFMLDMVVMNMIYLVLLLIYIGITASYKEVFKEYFQHFVEQGSDRMSNDIKMTQVILFPIYCFIAIFFEYFSAHATPGKKAMGIIIVKSNNKSISFFNVFARNAFKLIMIVFWPIGYVLSRLNPEGRWLHDRISGLEVREERYKDVS